MCKFYHASCTLGMSYAPVCLRGNSCKGNVSRVLMFLLMLCSLCTTGLCQINISENNPIAENFNAMGALNAAQLPSGWKVEKNAKERKIGSYADAVTNTELSAANSMGTAATAGVYNFNETCKTSTSVFIKYNGICDIVPVVRFCVNRCRTTHLE